MFGSLSLLARFESPELATTAGVFRNGDRKIGSNVTISLSVNKEVTDYFHTC